MFCVVYLLRRWGEKLRPEEARRDPRQGWLYFGQTQAQFPQVDAVLYADDSKANEVLRLRNAHLKKIDGGGLMLIGNDSQKPNHWQPQVWWCVPGALDDLTAGT